MIRILLVDDQQLIRDGLKTMIEFQEDMEVVGEATNGREALEQAKEVNPDIVLMDIRMPEVDGVNGTKLLRQWNEEIKILILTTFNDEEFVVKALSEGARGYVLKDIPATELFERIRIINNGGAVMAPDIAATLLKHIQHNGRHVKSFSSEDTDNTLSVREKEVLTVVGRGLNNQQIAATLFISEGTVKNHIHNIMQKLCLYDRTHLVIYSLTGDKPEIS